jgi:hypothetical protein
MTGQIEEPDEFEPETKVDPADGIWEGDAVDVVETEQTDERETYVDEERREELVDPDDEDEEL